MDVRKMEDRLDLADNLARIDRTAWWMALSVGCLSVAVGVTVAAVWMLLM